MPQLVPRELLQQANVLQSMMRGGLRIIGPTIGALLVVTVGPGWAVAVDALTWVAASLLLLPVKLPKRERARGRPVHAHRAAGGLVALRRYDVAVGDRAGVRRTQRDPRGCLVHPRPAVGQGHDRRGRLGLVLSAESLGLLAMAAVMLRRRLERPLLLGMLGIASFGAAADPRGRAGAGAAACRGLRRRGGDRALRPRLEPRHAGEHRGTDALARLLLRHARLVRRDPGRPARLRPPGYRVRLPRRAGRQRHRLHRDRAAHAAVSVVRNLRRAS